jgi:hypothetical protein
VHLAVVQGGKQHLSWVEDAEKIHRMNYGLDIASALI